MEHTKKSICSAVYKLFATFGRISNPTLPKDTWRKNLAQYYLCNSWWFSSELVRCEAFLFLADFAKGRGQKANACTEPQIFNLGASVVALGGHKCHHQQFGTNNRGKFLLWQCQTPQRHWMNTRLTLHLIGFSKGFANTVPLQPVWELVFNFHLNTNEEQPVFSPWKDHLIYK